MLDLYFAPTPNGWKITIMLEECGLPYAVKPVNLGKGDQFKPEFLKISPNNRMPAIVDHDAPGKPISIFESGAILQYLAEKTGRFMPRELHARFDVMQWLFWQVGGLGPMAGQLSHFVNYAPGGPGQHVYSHTRYANEYDRLFAVMERSLSEREYLAGDYSIADIANWAWVRTHKWSGVEIEPFPHLSRWSAQLAARPACQRGIEVPPRPVRVEDGKGSERFIAEARKMVETGHSGN